VDARRADLLKRATQLRKKARRRTQRIVFSTPASRCAASSSGSSSSSEKRSCDGSTQTPPYKPGRRLRFVRSSILTTCSSDRSSSSSGRSTRTWAHKLADLDLCQFLQVCHYWLDIVMWSLSTTQRGLSKLEADPCESVWRECRPSCQRLNIRRHDCTISCSGLFGTTHRTVRPYSAAPCFGYIGRVCGRCVCPNCFCGSAWTADMIAQYRAAGSSGPHPLQCSHSAQHLALAAADKSAHEAFAQTASSVHSKCRSWIETSDVDLPFSTRLFLKADAARPQN
jgi:hypothetical protein